MPVISTNPSDKVLEKLKGFLGNQWETFKQQPLMQMAGAGSEMFDKLYRGNTADIPGYKLGGIPFGPGQTVFHGTSKLYNKMNPYHNNPNDLFGKMTHFAESPEYAGEQYSGTQILDDIGDPFYNSPGSQRPRVIPAKLDVKNALDVSPNNPDLVNWDDLNKLFKNSTGRLQGRLGEQGRFADDMANYLKQIPDRMNKSGGAKYQPSYGPAPNKLPRDFVAKILREDPSALNRTGFDAIKYTDNLAQGMNYPNANVWAIENPYLAKSSITGEPLGINVKPSNLERLVGGNYKMSPVLENYLDLRPGIIDPQLRGSEMASRVKSLGSR